MSADCAWVSFQLLMFKSSCLVFQVQRLESLCLVSAPYPPSVFSSLWRKVSCHVLLIWAGPVESSVPSILTMPAVGMNCHCPLTAHTPSCGLVFIHRAQWKILPTFLEKGESPFILSPVLFSRWSTVGPSQKPFAGISGLFTTPPYRVLHLQLESITFFSLSLLWTWRKIVYTACELFLELIACLSKKERERKGLALSLAEHNVPLFCPLEGRPYCPGGHSLIQNKNFKGDLDGSNDWNLQRK